MSEADGTIPTTVTRKRKRGTGFRYSSKKVLERSRVRREAAKGRVLEFGSMKKALSYPVDLLSEIGVVDLAECCTGSFQQLSLHSVDENLEVRTDTSLASVDSDVEGRRNVSVILSNH